MKPVLTVASIGASDLAQIISDVLVNTFSRMGIVSLTQAQNAAPVKDQASVKQAPSIAHHTGPKVTRNVPAFGDFHCTVGQSSDGERVGRAKLPMGMFEGFSNIIINLPDGTWVSVNCDSEGRGRLSKSDLDKLRVPANSTLVFTSVGEGQFDLFVGPSEAPAPMATTKVTGPTLPRKAAQVPSLETLFAAPVASKAPKARSAAQLANDEKLRAMAHQRNEQRNASNTPQYVVSAPKGRQITVEKGRAANRQAAGNNQKAFAGLIVPTLPSAAPKVPVKVIKKAVEAPRYNVPESFRVNGRKK